MEYIPAAHKNKIIMRKNYLFGVMPVLTVQNSIATIRFASFLEGSTAKERQATLSSSPIEGFAVAYEKKLVGYRVENNKLIPFIPDINNIDLEKCWTVSISVINDGKYPEVVQAFHDFKQHDQLEAFFALVNIFISMGYTLRSYSKQTNSFDENAFCLTRIEKELDMNIQAKLAYEEICEKYLHNDNPDNLAKNQFALMFMSMGLHLGEICDIDSKYLFLN